MSLRSPPQRVFGRFAQALSLVAAMVAILAIMAMIPWFSGSHLGDTVVLNQTGPPTATVTDTAILPQAVGAEAALTSTNLITATTTGIGDRVFGATASVLGTDTAFAGVLPMTATLAAIAVTTFFALWYTYRLTRRRTTTLATVGTNGDGTILDGLYFATRSGMRTALGRVAKIGNLAHNSSFSATVPT